MSYISIEQVISAAKIRLLLTDTSAADMALEQYVLSGLRKINALDSYVMRRETLDIENGVAELPCGFVEALTLIYEQENATVDGIALTPSRYRAIYVNVPYIRSQECNVNDAGLGWSGTYQIIGNHIMFNSEVTATTCDLTFMGRNLDCNGILLIPEAYESALTEYTCWEYARSRPYSNIDMGGYTNAQIQSYRAEWMAQRAWCVGSAVQAEAKRTRYEIMSTVNAVLSNRNAYTKI